MERKNINKEYQWNLNPLLNKKSLDFYYKNIDHLTNEILKLQNNITKNINNFQKFLNLKQELDIDAKKIICYLYNKSSEDTRNQENYSNLLKFQNFLNECNSKLYWIHNELLDSESKIQQFLKNDLSLSKYDKYFQKVFRYQKHRLSNENESLLTNLSSLFDSNENLFSVLTSTDFKFKDIVVDKNKVYHLNQGTYRKYLTHENSKIREQAYTNYWSKYYEFKNTLATNYYFHIQQSVKLAKIYKFNSVLENELFSNNLSLKFYDNLLSQCKKHSFLTLKWKKIVCKLIDNNDPTPWDISQPLFKQSNKQYSISEAQKIISNALKPLGEDYQKKIKTIFNNNCIDFMPNDGKRPGAYSFGVWNEMPYICMNWNGKYLDLSTLIHELGHSIHTLYSNEHQPYQYHDYPIFLAEIASITNEMLLVKYLLKIENDLEYKKVILENAITTIFATIFRQVQFGEFEKWVHDEIRNHKVLTSYIIEQKCISLNNIYYPKLPTQKYQDKYQGLWGLFVPHFYRDYYVFQYATSMICACIIVNKIDKDPSYYQKYLYLLSQGNYYWPLDILKKIGIDLEKDAVYKEAFNLVEDFINNIEKIIFKK